ncbi:MAG: hypothetical protein V1721_03315 [Pseudomonadota bacterium]
MKDEISPEFSKIVEKDPYPDTRESFNKKLKPVLDKLFSLSGNRKDGEKFEEVKIAAADFLGGVKCGSETIKGLGQNNRIGI